MSGYSFTKSRVYGTVRAAIPYCNGASFDISSATISACSGAGGGSGAGFYGGGGGGGVPINAFDKPGLKPKEYFEKQGYEVTEDHFGNGEAYDKNMNVVASWSWSE